MQVTPKHMDMPHLLLAFADNPARASDLAFSGRIGVWDASDYDGEFSKRKPNSASADQRRAWRVEMCGKFHLGRTKP